MHFALKYPSIVNIIHIGMIEMCGTANRVGASLYDTINQFKSGALKMISWTFMVTRNAYTS